MKAIRIQPRRNFAVSDKPDRMEKGVRLGCGGLAGLVAGLFAAVRVNPNDAVVFFGIILVLAVLFALGALGGGDEFWFKSIRRWRWW